VISCATLALSLTLPQLRVEPYQVELGAAVAVRVEPDGAVRGGVAIAVDLPDGNRRELGATDPGGMLSFVPDQVGEHVARAQVGELQVLAPFQVVAARPRWLLYAGCVPLGLALLWFNLRRRAGGACGDQPSTRLM
jgi:hypothetical protein